jgi:zinc/manganese transport system substrate-binding protein
MLKFLMVCACATLSLLSSIGHAAQPVAVVASFSILGDLVQVVGGDRVKLTTLVGPNADAHAFTPNPAHAKTLLGARLLVINGFDFEPWAQKLATSAGFKGVTVLASNGVKPRPMSKDKRAHAHVQIDPHAWQNPQNVVVYVNNIAAGLAQVDPAGAVMYKTNADAYVQQLWALDAQAQVQLDAIAGHRRKIITSHDAFGYLGDRYGITLLAPEGINTDAEPSAKHVAELIRQVKREAIQTVFVENMRNPKLIEQLGKDAGAHVGGILYSDALSGTDGPASTYLKLMHHNLTQLMAAMKTQPH